MFDEEPPKKRNTEPFPRNLERLSVAELADYIKELEEEIIRVQGDIDRKKASQDAAALLFGKP